MPALRIAVVGHVEHVTLGRVDALPREGDIAHLSDPVTFPGGGGGVAFFQLAKSSATVSFFTALGNDDAAALMQKRLAATGAAIYAASRPLPHTRDVVLVTPSGERTIVVVGQPLQPERADALPWETLSECDAVYFTGRDPEVLHACRRAKILVVTARRRAALIASGVQADVVVGSRHDPREVSDLDDYPVPPTALVLTEGRDGGRVLFSDREVRFEASVVESGSGGAYGAGDSFAGALTYHLAAGLGPEEAARRAAHHGAAVLAHLEPLSGQRPLP